MSHPEHRSARASLLALNLHLKQIEELAERQGGSCEGFSRTLLSIGDFFGRVLNNLKTYALRAFSNFKRSELRAFLDSHALTTTAVLKNKAGRYGNIPVAIPDGMIKPYLPVTTFLSEWSAAAEFSSVMVVAETYLALYDKLGIDEYEDLVKETEEATAAISKVSQKDIEKKLRTMFVARHTPDNEKASKVLPDHRTLMAVHIHVLGFEADYIVAMNLSKRLDAVDANVGKLVNQLKRLSSVDGEYLKALTGFVSTLAEQVDMFGVLLDYEQRVEHNYVLALRSLSDNVGKK